ncbi:MAG: DNA methyltransferase, partial [Desulfobacteraceae bacterium]|nr:DNA methyltransferase [Desulfobacteraceae bacterium]
MFKQIADTIIDFLAQIENFQKNLWEKKKFVLNTEWVITIDRLVAYIGEETAVAIIAEVLENNAQISEWLELFGEKIIPAGKLTVENLRSELFSWPKLPIDTVHFSKAFKENLLNTLSATIDLEAMTDGLVMHSDNYHGLTEIQEKFKDSISPVYIDPPYNTDASAIIYKNDYKSSSFLSLISERVKLARPLLKKDSMICVAIDDVEVMGLRHILKEHFLKEVGIVAVRSNPAGRKTRGKFSPAHEYALFFGQSENVIPCSLDITEKRLDRYPKKDENGNFSWANFIRSGNNDKREDRPKLYYPIFVNKNGLIRIPEMVWDENKNEYVLLENPNFDEDIVHPVIRSGKEIIEKNWQRGHQRVAMELHEYRVRKSTNGDINIDFKTRLDENSLPTTWWDKKEYASANYGAAELKELFNFKLFDFPKARKLVQDCIRAAGALDKNSITLDFFPGSATTFDAVQHLNQDDNGKRKCILIEQGHHIYSIILPRIKKIACTFDWKDGRPKDGGMNGPGVFFKYQRLEQYEETLANISFTVPEETAQKALEFDSYIPKYFLEFETRGSQTL